LHYNKNPNKSQEKHALFYNMLIKPLHSLFILLLHALLIYVLREAFGEQGYSPCTSVAFLKESSAKNFMFAPLAIAPCAGGLFCCVGERVVWKCFGALQMTTIFRCTSVNPRPPHKVISYFVRHILQEILRRIQLYTIPNKQQANLSTNVSDYFAGHISQ